MIVLRCWTARPAVVRPFRERSGGYWEYAQVYVGERDSVGSRGKEFER